MNGHLELYRIFNPNQIEYILGYELLLKMITAFIIMIMFFSAIILLISSLVKEHKMAIAILSLLVIGMKLVGKKDFN